MLLIVLVFVLFGCVSLRTEFRVVRSTAISAYSYARFVIDSNCLWEGRILFTLFVFVCIWWCQTHIVLFFMPPRQRAGGHINLPLSVRPDIDTWFVRLTPPTVLELQL